MPQQAWGKNWERQYDAKQRNIKGRSTMTKRQLQNALGR